MKLPNFEMPIAAPLFVRPDLERLAAEGAPDEELEALEATWQKREPYADQVRIQAERLTYAELTAFQMSAQGVADNESVQEMLKMYRQLLVRVGLKVFGIEFGELKSDDMETEALLNMLDKARLLFEVGQRVLQLQNVTEQESLS